MTNEDVIIIHRWSNEDPHKNRDNENSEKDFEYKRHFKENIGKSLNRLDIKWCQRIGRVKENSRGTTWVVFLIAKSRVRKVAYLKLAQFSKLLLMASCAKVLCLSFWKSLSPNNWHPPLRKFLFWKEAKADFQTHQYIKENFQIWQNLLCRKYPKAWWEFHQFHVWYFLLVHTSTLMI